MDEHTYFSAFNRHDWENQSLEPHLFLLMGKSKCFCALSKGRVVPEILEQTKGQMGRSISSIER